MTKVHSDAYMTALEGLEGKCILATVTGRGVEDLSGETPFQYQDSIMDQATQPIRIRVGYEKSEARTLFLAGNIAAFEAGATFQPSTECHSIKVIFSSNSPH